MNKIYAMKCQNFVKCKPPEQLSQSNELRIFRSLSNDTSIVITQAGKGRIMVILNHVDNI